MCGIEDSLSILVVFLFFGELLLEFVLFLGFRLLLGLVGCLSLTDELDSVVVALRSIPIPNGWIASSLNFHVNIPTCALVIFLDQNPVP